MASELKPCPFCGGAAEMDTLRPYRNFTTGAVEDACAIYCLECSAEQSFCYRDAPGVDRDGVIADVEARWNTRSESLTAMEEQLAQALRPITMQDVRLATGEGKLTAADVLEGCNAEIRRRAGLLSALSKDTSNG